MQRKLFVLAIAALFVAPFGALADPDVLGVPDFTCQTSAEWQTHDYGAPATGFLVSGISDNNLEDCPGVYTYGLFIAGTPECRRLADDPPNADDPASPLHALWLRLCRTDRPADYDGDLEYAQGGAYLVSDSGDANSGGLVCTGTFGHHPGEGGTIYVNDLVFPNVGFTVTADFSRPDVPPVPGEPDCGDGNLEPCDPTPPEESGLPEPVGGVVDTVNGLLYVLLNGDGTTCNSLDKSITCVNRCTLPFGPGADGAYVVFVGSTLSGNAGEPTGATQGHVSTGPHTPPPPIFVPMCGDGFDNDFDGATDYPDDPDCTSENDLSETCLPEGCVDLSDPDPVGQPDPDLEDPSSNAPPPPVGFDSEDPGIQSCGSVHLHGTQKSSSTHGTYYDGTVWAHFHHCNGQGNWWSGTWFATKGVYAFESGHDTVELTWGDGNYHTTCIRFVQNDNTEVGRCWKQRN